jgi:hypothetical protein
LRKCRTTLGLAPSKGLFRLFGEFPRNSCAQADTHSPQPHLWGMRLIFRGDASQMQTKEANQQGLRGSRHQIWLYSLTLPHCMWCVRAHDSQNLRDTSAGTEMTNFSNIRIRTKRNERHANHPERPRGTDMAEDFY